MMLKPPSPCRICLFACLYAASAASCVLTGSTFLCRLFPYELDADKLWEVLTAMQLQEKVGPGRGWAGQGVSVQSTRGLAVMLVSCCSVGIWKQSPGPCVGVGLLRGRS
jgi:hypothetical protein